jgi:hypothetical protein
VSTQADLSVTTYIEVAGHTVAKRTNGGIDKQASWSKVLFNEGASITLTGCNAGGRNGYVIENSIAQHIANVTQVNTFAYVNSTSQRRVDGRLQQVPVRMVPDDDKH